MTAFDIESLAKTLAVAANPQAKAPTSPSDATECRRFMPDALSLDVNPTIRHENDGSMTAPAWPDPVGSGGPIPCGLAITASVAASGVELFQLPTWSNSGEHTVLRASQRSVQLS